MAASGPCCPSGGRNTWTSPPMEDQGQGTGYTPGPPIMHIVDGSGPSWTTAGKTGGLPTWPPAASTQSRGSGPWPRAGSTAHGP